MWKFSFRFNRRTKNPHFNRRYSNYNYFEGRKTFFGRLKTEPRFAAFVGIGVGIPVVLYFGRHTFFSISEEKENKLGEKMFENIKIEYKSLILPQEHKHTKAVKQIGYRLVKSSGNERLQKMNWEFVVIQSNIANAFVLPGGKVVVFTGILPLMANEDGMATVLGHEIAHVAERHAADNMSMTPFIITVRIIFDYLFNSPALSAILTNLIFDKPFSRKRETEADKIGLSLMSKACFDPTQAPEVWKRFQKMQGNSSSTFKYLSTHPSHYDRISNLQHWMNEAKDERERSHCPPLLQQRKLPVPKGTKKVEEISPPVIPVIIIRPTHDIPLDDDFYDDDDDDFDD